MGNMAASTVNPGQAETSRHTSAGTLVAVPTTMGVQYAYGNNFWDASSTKEPGRIAVAWLDVFKGIYLVSIYLHDGEGWSERNTAIMQHLAKMLATLSAPWILGGDFNMEPEVLEQGYWWSALGAVIVAPQGVGGTCRTRGTKRIYDYFVLHPMLKPYVQEVRVMEEWHSAPHKPVMLTLRVEANTYWQRVQRRPRDLPVGDWVEGKWSQVEWPTWNTAHTQTDVDDAWRSVVTSLESEIIQGHGISADEHSGRAKDPKWVCRPVKWQPKHNGPRCGEELLAMQWVANKLQELCSVVQKCIQREHATDKQQQVMAAIATQCSVYKLRLTGEQGAKWERILRTIGMGLGWTCQEAEPLHSWTIEARAEAEVKLAEAKKEEQKSWSAFLDRAAMGQAGLLHKLSKPVVMWRPRLDHSEQGDTQDPLKAADVVRAEWAAEWRVDEPLQPRQRPWETSEVEPMPAITAEQVQIAGRSFKEHTGVGADLVHPRLYGHLTPQGCQAVANLLNDVERLRRWPKHQQCLLYFLSLKPNGKDRPIGLLPSLIRLWEAVRVPIMQDWLRQYPRAWDCCAAGNTCEGAVWETLLAHEADGIVDKPHQVVTATLIIDLVKAFERAQLQHVWEWGMYYNFPKALLAMILTYFGYARRLVVDGCVSEQLQTCTAIVAGSRFSVCLLRMVLQWPMDELQRQWPDMRLKVFVDDASLQLRRAQWRLAQDLPSLVDMAIDLLSEVGLEISRGALFQPGGKSHVVMTSPWLRDRLKTTFRRRGIDIARAAVYLGVDMAPNLRKKCKRAERRATFTRRLTRVLSLKRSGGKPVRRGVRHVLQNGLKPAFLYGAKCLGINDKDLYTLRVGLRKAGTSGKGSTTMQLALARMEPTMQVSGYPIRLWCSAIWDGHQHEYPYEVQLPFRETAELMQEAWRTTRALAVKPNWKDVHGPAAAITMHLRRADWQWPRWYVWKTRDKHWIDLRERCPNDVVKMFERDVEAVMWSKWTERPENAHLAPAPYMQPLVQLVNKKSTSDWTAQQASALRHVVCSGPVTQTRLAEWYPHMVQGENCQLCGTDYGTPMHRYHLCPCTRQWRRENLPKEWQHVAETSCQESQSACHGVDHAADISSLWHSGLTKVPWAGWGAFETIPDEWQEHVFDSVDSCFTGHVYGDGSLKGKGEFAQCGWAVARKDGHEVVHLAYGPLPINLPVQRTIKRAEL